AARLDADISFLPGTVIVVPPTGAQAPVYTISSGVVHMSIASATGFTGAVNVITIKVVSRNPGSGLLFLYALDVSGVDGSSMTARLAYDTSGVRFIREEALSDGATRVINPQPGLVRFAAIAANGFADGRVYTLRFSVIRSSALRSFDLTADEAHTISQANLV